MRYRPMFAVAMTAAVIASMPAHAATKTLDGKKTKSLTFTATSSPQDNDPDAVTDQAAVGPLPARPANYDKCPASRCLTYSFVYKPAKGVKRGPFSVKIAWTLPGQDYDLYVYQGGGDVGHCGASAGTSEVVVIDTAIPGKTYKVIVDEYRAGPDTVTGKVSFPATDKVGSSVPEPPVAPTNCGLS